MSLPESIREPRRALRWLLVVAGLCLCLPLDAAEPPRGEMSAAQRQAMVKERDRLIADVNKLQAAGKLAEAIAAAEKKLVLERQLFGDGDTAVVDSLQWLARLHEQKEDFTTARKKLREALDIQTGRYGKDDWRATDARLALADLELRAMLDDKQRKQLAEAERLNGQVMALTEKGGSREAVSLAERALALRKEVLGDKHPDYAQSLNNLAELCSSMGDSTRAEPLYRQALDIKKQVLGDRHPDYAESLNGLAWLYQKMGEYARAEPLFQQALHIRKQAQGEKHSAYAQSLNNLAFLYERMGDYSRAEPMYLQALTITKQAQGEKNADYAMVLHNLARLKSALGHFAEAERLLKRALMIEKNELGVEHPSYLLSLGNLAVLYRQMGDSTKAEQVCRQTLLMRKKVLGEKSWLYANDLAQWALCFAENGDYARAEPLLQKAVEITRQALGEKHPFYADKLSYLAGLYWAMGDFGKSEPLYRQALKIKKQVLGEKHPAYATSLNSLAVLYQSMGEFARAELLYQQARDIRKQVLGGLHPDYAQTLNNLAFLRRLMGSTVRAEPLYREALEITRHCLQVTAPVQSERQQLAMQEDLRYQLDSYLSAVVQEQATTKLPSDSTLPALYAHMLAWKGSVFLQQRRQRLARRHPELTSLFEKLQQVSCRLATRALAVPAPQQRHGWQQDIADLTEQKEQLESELAHRSAAFDRDRQLARLTARELSAVLPADAVLLDFLEYWHAQSDAKKPGKLQWQRHLAAFVVRRDSLALVDLGPLQPISQAIDRWRSSTRRTRPIVGEKDPAVELRRQLWQPLERHLRGARLVLVSPDGALARLPLAALPGSDPDKYLLEEVPLAVVPVPQLLPELLAADKPDAKSEPSLLLVGDVDFGAEAGVADTRGASRAAARDSRSGGLLRFTGLDATREEILAVRDSFEQRYADGSVKWLRAAAASEAAVRQQAPKHRFLHFATHGFFAPPELRSALAPAPARDKGPQTADLFGRQGLSGFHPGLLSGLALAGANRPAGEDADDGILTALEVAEMDLSRVELATLSACETGLGETAGGEGLLGLQRAFQAAGAGSVVASLWKVDDEATRKLMARFYESLWRSKEPLSKLESLREAQLWMLREGIKRGLAPLEEEAPAKGARTPPHYWAAFVLSGDWR